MGAMSLKPQRDRWRIVSLPETPLWTLHFDGSCPKNPGPMGVGYTLGIAGYPPIVRVGAQVGEGTNNAAEYQALLAGMRAALRLGMWRLRIVSDAALVVNHYSGQWKARDFLLQRLLRESLLLARCFASPPKMEHTFRENNEEADALSRTLENVAPKLPEPRPGRALLGWQAAAVNVWWWSRDVRSPAILARVFGVQEVQIDQIVTGKSYSDASFEGHPTYEDIRTGEPDIDRAALRALPL